MLELDALLPRGTVQMYGDDSGGVRLRCMNVASVDIVVGAVRNWSLEAIGMHSGEDPTSLRKASFGSPIRCNKQL